MASEKLEIILDTAKCQGYGLCLGLDDVFEMDTKANIAVQKVRFVDLSRKAEVEQAARDCPAGAISCRVVRE